MFLAKRGVLMLLALLALAACGEPYTYQALRVMDNPTPAPEVALTDQAGRPFRLSEHQGKVVVLFFGFTSCPDICPTTLGDMAYVHQQLGPAAAKLQVVFVSVDPARDTGAKLSGYLSLFNPTFLGLRTDDPAALERVLKEYGAAATRRDLPGSGLGYTMDHSASLYVIDQQGRWLGLYGYGEPMDPFIEDLRHLLDA